METNLSPAVDDVNLMQGDGMDHLLPLLQFALGTLDEPGARPSGVVVASSGKTSSCKLSVIAVSSHQARLVPIISIRQRTDQAGLLVHSTQQTLN